MQTNEKKRFGWAGAAALLLSLSQAAACSDGDSDDDAGNGAEGGPLFAVPTEVYGADFATSTSYIPSCPRSTSTRSASTTPARSTAAPASRRVGDWLFIASSSAPIIERFERAGGRLAGGRGAPQFLELRRARVLRHRCLGRGLRERGEGLHLQRQRRQPRGLEPDDARNHGRNPGPDVVVDGYNLESIAFVRGNRMYRLFTVLNYDSWEFLAEPQYLAVYDLEKDELIDLVEETALPAALQPSVHRRGRRHLLQRLGVDAGSHPDQ